MPRVRASWFAVLSAGVLLACGGGSGGGGTDPETPTTTAEQLVALKAHGIYFGHQSVGSNIMQGVDDLLAAVPEGSRLGRGGLSAARTGVWADGGVGSNGDALGKIADFQSQMAGLCGKVDIAFMKFCWADTGSIESAGASAVLAAYDAMVTTVRSACPSVTLVHFTIPLETTDNTFREQYNALVRTKYGSAVFDLAAEEATKPDGSHCTSGSVRVLCDGYHPSDDGGHLDATGRQQIAKKLIEHLAKL